MHPFSMHARVKEIIRPALPDGRTAGWAMIREGLRGSIVPLVTPFDASGGVDEAAVLSLIEFQIAGGSHGISVAGTTGEPSSLTHGERERLFEVAVGATAGRRPVVAGTGTNNLPETLRLTSSAEKAGADAALVIVPYYNRPSQEGLYRYFRDVSSSTSLPVIIYNIPGRTATNMEASTAGRLRGVCGNLVGIKESNRDMDQVTRLLQECGDDFLVYSGIESLCLPMLAVGGSGHFSATANLLPTEVADLYNHAAAGRWDEARRLHHALFRINESIFWDTNPVPLKAAMAMLGRVQNILRPPLVPLSDDLTTRMRSLLHDYGLLPKRGGR